MEANKQAATTRQQDLSAMRALWPCAPHSEIGEHNAHGLSRFGAVEHDWTMQLHMPAGLLGFPEVKEYRIVDPEPELPVKWLQARDELHLAFVITDPYALLLDYRVELTPLDLMDVGAHAAIDLFLVAIVTLPRETTPTPR